MKKQLFAVFVILFSLAYSCKTSHTVKVYGKSGCWHEKYGRVCGVAERYNYQDSTYIMYTDEGWRMVIKASQIKWD